MALDTNTYIQGTYLLLSNEIKHKMFNNFHSTSLETIFLLSAMRSVLC